VRVEAGSATRPEPAVRARGTTVTVRDLFFATPGRRKFLKSDATELRRLLEAVVEASLTRSDVSFSVRSGARELLRLPVAGGLAERVAALYGPEYSAGLLPFSVEAGARRLSGLLQRPATAGRGPRRQLLFVNGRPVQDRTLVHAAFRGYASTLPSGAWPHVFLFLELPAAEVDVNVHPAKREVRFRDSDALFAFVQSGVRRGLGGLATAGALDRTRRLRRVPAGAGAVEPDASSPVEHAAPLALEPRGGYAAPTPDQLGLFLNARLRPREEGEEAAARDGGPRLWQLHDTYILAQTRAGLAVIDQHSAHERVLYEQFMRALESGRAPAQRLLLPITLHLGPAEGDAFEENREYLERLGFEVEGFGGNTLIVNSVPMPHPRFDAERCLRETLDALTGNRVAGTATRHEHLAATVACKAAIKAGEELSPGEMRSLFASLRDTELPAHDVHGRSTIVQLTWDELDRRFGRR
jgi:DNA mismatch repair protein MutL